MRLETAPNTLAPRLRAFGFTFALDPLVKLACLWLMFQPVPYRLRAHAKSGVRSGLSPQRAFLSASAY